ncbi:hypothetical protein JZ751_007434 [Albula glossodonta]|uniref:Uncharacterized protein n=1 Tax=Albula glossodonta TaxID=121402 RepID=A0A8T2N7L2_9TELE|nr:hypothetical protein JZ751_007434 [Albula glossodonta]
MKGQLTILALVVGLQAFMAMAAPQGDEDPQESSSWWSLARDYAAMYYEDHLKSVTDSYVQWASEYYTSVKDTATKQWGDWWS